MKILYICSTLSRSGPTNQLFGLLRHLVNHGVKCTVITISEEPEDSRLSDFLDLDIPHHCLRRDGWRFWVSGHQALRKLVRTIDPDIIHTSGIRADFLAARFLTSYPTLTTIHNIPWEDYRLRYGNLTGTLMLQLHVNIWKRIRSCVAVSEFLAGELSERYPFLPTVTIPNGIDTTAYISAGAQRPPPTSSEPFPRPVFVNTEGFIPLKNPLCVVLGFIRYKDNGGPGTLQLVGDGPLLGDARDLAHGRDDIVFYPRTASVLKYYQDADYFVSASQTEGLPLALLEALSCGLIPVVSAIGSRYEILRQHPFADYMFHPDHPEQLAERLEMAAKTKAGDHGSFFNDIRDRYSDAVMARRYLDAYAKLLP